MWRAGLKRHTVARASAAALRKALVFLKITIRSLHRGTLANKTATAATLAPFLAITMEIVTVHRRGPIAVIVLNNPRKLSALSSQGYFLLGERLRSVAKDSGIAVTIVTGKGKFFSA